jgi:hypothetical protein
MTRTPEQKQALDEVLQRGVNNSDAEMMRLSLEKGATPDKMVEGLTGRGTLGSVDPSLLTLALKKGADADLLLFAGIKLSSLPIVKLAVEQGGANVNATRSPPASTDVFPAADWSYQNFDSKVSDYLLSKGMDVNTRNAKGATPLFRATRDQNYSKVMHYLSHGADPMVANNDGTFPLSMLQSGNYGSYSSFGEKQSEMLRAMLKNVPDEQDAAARPAEAFNASAVSTHAAIEVNKPLELKKKPESAPGHPAKGFQL